ncbi:LysR family transcriptional regulator [Vagococcus sp. BWB3-3]|uniref:LysR family transcriptional regulator n=1 Tax=Vagococcus allomyrinae TaxID=2794353 RepID=A0A940PC57_9ENTE|nr:LysR family transcriptional regulator [Vagococcus allomyrinae]MBP1043396.1 LysR family transcriptional regulator [Vagococcus allomyrinae]
MNLHGLRLFHEVAKCGSVTKASEKLRISQPSVTAQIKKFEKDQEVQLIRPAGRGIQLTPLGEEVYQLSQELFAVEENITALFQEAKGQKSAVLRLGGNYLAVTHLLPEWQKRFKSQRPTCYLELATLNSSDLITALLAERLDMVFLGDSHLNDSRFVCHKVYEDRLCFIAHPSLGLAGGTLSLARLSESDFIGRERTSFTQQSLESLYRALGLRLPRFSLTYNNSRDALQAARAGKGVHYCSYLMASQSLAQGDLVELTVDLPIQPHDIYLYQLKQRELGEAGREFKKLVLAK